MKQIIGIIVLLLIVSGATVYADWTDNTPKTTEALSIGFTKIKDNFTFLKSIGQQLFAYQNGSSYSVGWQNTDPTNIFSLGHIIPLSSSSLFPRATPLVGDMYFDTDAHVLKIYHDTNWWAISSRLLTSDTNPTTCSAATLGMIYFNTTNQTTYECREQDSVYQWGPVAEARQTISGVNQVCDDAETCYDGILYLADDNNHIGIVGSVINGKKTFTVGYNSTSHSFSRSTDVQVAIPGKTNAPTVEKRGNSPIGTEIMWFSGDDARSDAIYFYWTSPPEGFDANTSITIAIYYVVESTSTNSVVLKSQVVGDVNTTSDISTTINLNGVEGLPTGDSVNVFDYDATTSFNIPSVWTTTGQLGKISITRDSANSNDTYTGKFGIIHISLTWGENYSW